MKLRLHTMFRFSTFFRSHGFRYSTISANRKPHLLVDYLMNSLRFSKQDAISVSTKAKRLSTNVSLLRNFGLVNERITMFVLSNPEKVMVNPELLETRLNYVEDKLGISRESPSFIHALSVVLWLTDSEMEQKMQIFRSFGWSDSDIALLFRHQPYCLNKSEANIRDKLKFYMKDLGYTPSYLISCASFFTFSLDKRVIPRNMMLKILKEKKLVNDKPSLITIASYTESKFLEFLRGFEDEIPSFREIYLDSVKRVS
ncbi:Mitochodrial transcription termination factor-related protein [Cynara cardunculus var. scolymus]|uniref:Mitochodrial transcription termination factor-related protein n=1 Tax=Cynara cardunculus var. scolymus TaxID=59895 RepID=A0A103YDR6_CYNCS|nr:Mitochodrial transcription termination factor-related protein [Cynara cardunculus var. scolymus]